MKNLLFVLWKRLFYYNAPALPIIMVMYLPVILGLFFLFFVSHIVLRSPCKKNANKRSIVKLLEWNHSYKGVCILQYFLYGKYANKLPAAMQKL